MANYNLKTLDPQHLETYRKCTDLLKEFMDRQWLIHKNKSFREYYAAESKVNSQIISIIQWIRYHLMGNDDASIKNKCPNIHVWYWRALGILIYNSPWACELLGLSGYSGRMMAQDVVEAILTTILPPRSKSIFAMSDNIQESITLQHELDRIRENYIK